MAEYTFKQFQAEYPDDAACLKRIMEIQYGGEETALPDLRQADAVSSRWVSGGLTPAKGAAITSTRPPAPFFTRAAPSSRFGSLQCIS